jgi:streptogramin lyase
MVTFHGGSFRRRSEAVSSKLAVAAVLALALVAVMASSAQAGTPAFVFSLKNSEGGVTQFKEPVGVGTDSAGNVYVVNKNAGRIEKFSSSGNFLAKFGSPGAGTGQLSQPTAVDVDPSGNVWVADQGNHRVVEFSPIGTFLRQVYNPYKLTGMATDSSGTVWFGGG